MVHTSVGEVYERLEPQVRVLVSGELIQNDATISAAISLKRIADALDAVHSALNNISENVWRVYNK